MDNIINRYSDIFNVLVTKDENQDCIEQIGNLLEAMYELNTKPQEQLIKEFFTPVIGDLIVQNMKKNLISLSDRHQCSEYFNGLAQALETAKTINITLSIQPDSEMLKAMSNFLQEKFPHEHFLLDVKVAPSLLGGAQIAWEGRYRNFSLAKKIDEWFGKKNNYENV